MPSIEASKTLARGLVEEISNQDNMAVLGELFEASSTPASIDPQVQSMEHMQQVTRVYRPGFPDLNLSIDPTTAEGDTVMVRWRASGTHTGVLMALALADAEAQPHDRLHLRLSGLIAPTKQRVRFAE